MKTALELDDLRLDEQEQRFIENIREHGWFGTHVDEDADEPCFSYTTGFWLKLGVPELVLFSLPMELSHQIFWNFFNDLKDGRRFPVDVPIPEVLDGYDVMLKPVLEEHYANHFGWSRWFYRGDHFQVNQLFFPDKSGKFPWDDGVGVGFKNAQPHLDKPRN